MPTPLRRVYDNVRTGQTVLRDAGRLGDILTVLARHGFGAFVQALRLQERWLPGKILDLRREPLEAMPVERRILLAVQDLGPTFVKLGQMASTRPDLFPAPLIAELSTLQDRVPPLPLEAVRGVVREELGAEVEEHFVGFSPDPLASASIAQVHRASLANGRAVVVKVQRPNAAALCGTLALPHGAALLLGLPGLAGLLRRRAGAHAVVSGPRPRALSAPARLQPRRDSARSRPCASSIAPAPASTTPPSSS